MKVGTKKIQHWLWDLILEVLIAQFAIRYVQWRKTRKTERDIIWEMNYRYLRGGKENHPRKKAKEFYTPTPIQVQILRAWGK